MLRGRDRDLPDPSVSPLAYEAMTVVCASVSAACESTH